MGHQVDQSDLLDWIEGVPLDQDKASRLEAIFKADSSLRHWAQEARRDRDRLGALWEIESRLESPGLAQAAMEQSQRDVLLGDAPIPIKVLAHNRAPRAKRPARRIRVTPVRFVAFAGIIIVTATASIIGVFFQNQPMQGPIAQAPSAGELVDLEPPIALADAKPARESLASEETSPTGANRPTRALALMQADKTGDTAGAIRAVDSVDSLALLAQAPGNSAAGAEPALTPLSFHLIHPSDHAPDHAASPAQAAQLALSGRLLLLIRAADPRAVEAALLQLGHSDDPLDPRWRSILELTGAQAANGGEPGSDAARIVLVDVLATPEGMERLIAAATRATVGADGAWLQEIADPVHLEPRLATDDLMWWIKPISAWARQTSIPVLVERVAPSQADDSTPAPTKPQP